MDARTVARISGVNIGLMNAWTNRDLIPGMAVGISGKRRDIDYLTAVRIGVFAALRKSYPGANYEPHVEVIKEISEDDCVGAWFCLELPPGMSAARKDCRFMVSRVTGIFDASLREKTAFVMVDVGGIARRFQSCFRVHGAEPWGC